MENNAGQSGSPTTCDCYNLHNGKRWGYGENDIGPATWAKNFPVLVGPRQSPVYIQGAVYNPELALDPLVINYNSSGLQLENTGLSLKAHITTPGISGGPLGSTKYKLEEIHFHWAQDNSRGSEHAVAGKIYPSEMHLVHYNADKFRTLADAKPYDLAVIGVFITVGGTDDHRGFETLAGNAGKVKHKGQKYDIDDGFNPAYLLPENTKNYWTYDGSLTTPPCYESVKWIVLKEEITISERQILALRNLCCDESGDRRIPHNYRPLQDLGGRTIYASFET